MPNIGPMEIGIILLIALLVFGPKKLPELGKGLGRGMRDFKRGISGEDEAAERAAEEAAAAKARAAELASPVVEVPKKVDESVAS